MLSSEFIHMEDLSLNQEGAFEKNRTGFHIVINGSDAETFKEIMRVTGATPAEVVATALTRYVEALNAKTVTDSLQAIVKTAPGHETMAADAKATSDTFVERLDRSPSSRSI